MKYGVAAILLALFVSVAAADLIRLKSGTSIPGEIVGETETTVKIRVSAGTIEIAKSEIEEIVKEGAEPPAEEPEPDEPRPGRSRGRTRPLGGVDLLRAVENGSIEVEARGVDLRTVKLLVTPSSGATLRLRVPEGTFFYFRVIGEDRRPAPDLISTKAVRFSLEQEPRTVRVPVVGADLGLRMPDAIDRYRASAVARPVELSRLAAVMPWAEPNAIQAAVWIITADAGYEDLTSSLALASGPGLGAGDIMAGMRLVDVSGLDLDSRKVFEDRFLLIGALAPPGGDSRLANWAMAKLSILGYGRRPTDAVSRVLDADPDADSLAAACHVAAELRLSGAAPSIRRLLDRPSLPANVRLAASNALASFARPETAGAGEPADSGGSATPEPHEPPAATPEGLMGLITALDRTDIREHKGALRALVEMEDRVRNASDRRRVASAATRYFLRLDCPFRSQATAVLRAYHDVVPLASVIRGSQSSDDDLRRASIGLLRHYPDAAATRRLEEILNEPGGEFLETALSALGDRPEARASILALMRSSDVSIRRMVVSRLSRLPASPEVELALIRGLSDADRMVRERAIAGLLGRNYAGSERATTELKRLLVGDPEISVRRSAANALVTILGPRAVPALEGALARARDDAERRFLDDALSRARRSR